MDGTDAVLARTRKMLERYEAAPPPRAAPAAAEPTTGPFVALGERLAALRAELDRVERDHRRVLAEMTDRLSEVEDRTQEVERREALIARQFGLFRQALKEI